MSSISRKLILASSLVALTLITTPAWALCKYGTPHCVNPNPGPKLPQVNTTRLPDGPPGNEDCKYYGNCDDGSPEGTGPDGGPNGGLGFPGGLGGDWNPPPCVFPNTGKFCYG